MLNESLILGLSLGVANCLSPGPLMILIIETGLSSQLSTALLVAISSFFADIVVIGICFLAGSLLPNLEAVKIATGILGTGFLIHLAIRSWRTHIDPKQGLRHPPSLKSFFRGFLATVLNPHPYIFWAAIGVPLAIKGLVEGNSSIALSLVIGFQFAFVGGNVLLATITHFIGKRFSERAFILFGRFSSLLFLGLAGFLFIETFRTLFLPSSHAALVPRQVQVSLVTPITGSDSSLSQGDLLALGTQAALNTLEPQLRRKNIQIIFNKVQYNESPDSLSRSANAILGSQSAVAFGYTFSDHVAMVAPLFQKAKMPLITPDATSNSIVEIEDYIHTSAASNDLQARALLELLKELHIKGSAVVIYAADCGYCVDLNLSLIRASKTYSQIRMHQSLPVSSSAVRPKELERQLRALTPAPSVYFVPDFEITSANVIEAIKAVNPKAVILGADGWSMFGGSLVTQKLTSEMTAYSLAHWSIEDKNAVNETFNKLMTNIPVASRPSAAMAFDGMLFLGHALLNCSQFDRTSMEKCISKQQTVRLTSGLASYSKKKGMLKPVTILKVNHEGFTAFRSIKIPDESH